MQPVRPPRVPVPVDLLEELDGVREAAPQREAIAVPALGIRISSMSEI